MISPGAQVPRCSSQELYFFLETELDMHVETAELYEWSGTTHQLFFYQYASG